MPLEAIARQEELEATGATTWWSRSLSIFLAELARKFSVEEGILPGVDRTVGRPGMELWQILVMGVLKQGLGCDFDRLQELVNQLVVESGHRLAGKKVDDPLRGVL